VSCPKPRRCTETGRLWCCRKCVCAKADHKCTERCGQRRGFHVSGRCTAQDREALVVGGLCQQHSFQKSTGPSFQNMVGARVWAYRGAFAVSSAASLGLVLKLGPRQRLVALATASSAALLGVFSIFSLRSKLLQNGKTDKEREQVNSRWTLPQQTDLEAKSKILISSACSHQEQSDLALVEVLRQTSAFGAELPEGVTVVASYSKNHAVCSLSSQYGVWIMRVNVAFLRSSGLCTCGRRATLCPSKDPYAPRLLSPEHSTCSLTARPTNLERGSSRTP